MTCIGDECRVTLTDVNHSTSHEAESAAAASGIFCIEDAAALADAIRQVVFLLGKALVNQAADVSSYPDLRLEAPPKPQIRTVAYDYIICLEDGRKVKSLTHYLRRFGMTPQQYRFKWGLPDSYPMVTQELSEKRAAVARRIKPHLKRRRSQIN